MGVVAESEWRGGEQKKLEFCKVDMPTNPNPNSAPGARSQPEKKYDEDN